MTKTVHDEAERSERLEVLNINRVTHAIETFRPRCPHCARLFGTNSSLDRHTLASLLP